MDNKGSGERPGLPYAFYYKYTDDAESECNLAIQPGNRTLYICHFPEDDVRLFNDLKVSVRIRDTNQTLYHRTLEVEKVGLIDHPKNIKAFWAGNGNVIQVTWNSPNHEFRDFFRYQVQYWPENSTHTYDQIINSEDLPCRLKNLQYDLFYHLHVRTQVNEGDDSFWGPWSETITFFSLASPDKIELRCVTPDLFLVCCKWNKVTEYPHALQQLFYHYGEHNWQLCERNINMTDCNCVFMAKNDSQLSIIVNISSADHLLQVFFKEPFWINHVVSPPPPDLHLQQVPGGKLALNWTLPVSGLEQDMIYEIRFSKDAGTTWKTLQIPRGVSHEVLDLMPGSRYSLQIRSCPSGDRIQGFWSSWSEAASITLPSSKGWLITTIVLVLLSVPGAVLCIYCVLRPFYRKLKDILWPPLPNLHHVLDTFLTEIQKQYKTNPTFYEKPTEDVFQPSCLEILGEEAISPEILHISRDYVQLSPPRYQNEDYWPKLSPNISNASCHQPTNAISNQTYLTTGWNL
ncbi:thrombopoietin receptor isoform X3 [Pelobates cultripes]|uniref:Thrombopoietin receptor isoform X3 n=1 Tax=Pelobates cultripes TaxID=61616 RepID=A0AAD1WJM0_PELCU|nr:thrombopoietin receptor isoform X3 [Pelobates cultripes]